MNYELLLNERLRHRALIRGHAHEIHAVGETADVDADGRIIIRPYNGADNLTINVNHFNTLQLYIVHCALYIDVIVGGGWVEGDAVGKIPDDRDPYRIVFFA